MKLSRRSRALATPSSAADVMAEATSDKPRPCAEGPSEDHPHEDNMRDISERLMRTRYGELQCLRTLALCAKRSEALQELLSNRPRHQQCGSSSAAESQDVPPLTASQEQSTQTHAELRALSASSRVSGIAREFRGRLERVLSATASQTTTPRARSTPSTLASSIRSRSSSATPTPPLPARQDDDALRPADVQYTERLLNANPVFSFSEDAVRADIERLEAGRQVHRILNDQTFRDGLEALLLQRRTQNPVEMNERRALAIRESRADAGRPPRARHGDAGRTQPPMPPLAPSTFQPPHSNGRFAPPGVPASIESLGLVTGASFELLLSIQRMLQQDLGAALSRSGADGAPGAGPLRDEAVDEREEAAAVPRHSEIRPFVSPPQNHGRLGACVVCTTAEVNTVFYRCGHMCTCAQCAHALRRRRASCPICRAPVRDVVQVFLACAPTGAAATDGEAAPSAVPMEAM